LSNIQIEICSHEMYICTQTKEGNHMVNCLVVGIGGFIGSVCRYLVGLIPLNDKSGFPYKTLAINILGAFVLGCISAYAAKNPGTSPRLILMLKVGVCGGFTTFSTFAYESSTLFSDGRSTTALAYVLISVTAGILAVFLAQQIIHA
jgi:CrcB protein